MAKVFFENYLSKYDRYLYEQELYEQIRDYKPEESSESFEEFKDTFGPLSPEPEPV